MTVNRIHQIFNIICSTIVLLLSINLSTSAGNEEVAKKLFEEGNYAEALSHYEQLYNLYPNDANIQYGYGACLVETGVYNQKAKKLLLKASILGTQPKVNFYIGKVYHALNEFETASNYYTRFEKNAKKKDFKSVDFKTIKEACLANENPFIQSREIENSIVEDPVPDEPVDSMELETPVFNNPKIEAEEEISQIIEEEKPAPADSTSTVIETTIEVMDTIDTPKSNEEIPVVTVETTDVEVEMPTITTITNELVDTLFSFMLTSNIEYIQIHQFKTEEGKNQFINGWNKNIEFEHKLAEIGRLRKSYSESNNDDEKAQIAKQVLDLELSVPQLKSQKDDAYFKSREAELAYWNTKSEEEKEQLSAANDSIIKAWEMAHAPQPEVEEELIEEVPLADTIRVVESIDEEIIDEESDELIFRIQIGAYSKGLPEYIDKLYKKLSVLRKIDHYTDDRGVVVYTVGELSNLDDAITLQKQIRQEGVKDAFVVAYNKGKRITLKEARKIINQ